MPDPMSKENNDINNSQLSTLSPQLRNRPLQVLGMAKKAGLLAIGSDAVKTAAREGSVKLIILASDTSKSSIRQAEYSAEDSKTISITTPYTKFELGSFTGRGSPGTLAFLDLGLAAGFMEKLAALDAGRYEAAAETVAVKLHKAREKAAKTRTHKEMANNAQTTNRKQNQQVRRRTKI